MNKYLKKIPVFGEKFREEKVNSDPKLPEIGDYHKDIIAPSGIEEERKIMRVGEDYVSIVFIREWQDLVSDGFIDRLLAQQNIETDISIQLRPLQTDQITEDLSQKITGKRAQVKSKQENRELQKERQEELQNLEEVEKALEQSGAKLYNAGFYILLRGKSKEEVRKNRRKIHEMIEEEPINSESSTIIDNQAEALSSCAPINKDDIGYQRKLLSGAVGSMYPFTSKKRLDRKGVEAGIHRKTHTPIFFNRWEFENGYNQMTIGKIGSGKSFSTKTNLLRAGASRDDLKIFMIDPLGGFKDVYKFFDSKRIVVGGDIKINPLQINESPIEKIEESGYSDPYTINLSGVKEFFASYFDLRGTDFGNERAAFEKALNATYQKAGITKDPRTHSKKSPTIMDLIDTLEDMVDNPNDYVGKDREKETQTTEGDISISKTDIKQLVVDEMDEVQDLSPEQFDKAIEDLEKEEQEKIYEEAKTGDFENRLAEEYRDYALEVLGMLEAFRPGNQYHNFAQPTEEKLDISNVDSAWIDLQEIEGGGDKEELGWIMKLLLDQIYSRAKGTDDKTMIAIDEAHYLLKNDTSISYLNNIVRHSRHFNIGINFITQDIIEFFDNPGGEAIVNNCSIKWIHFKEGGFQEHVKDGLNIQDRHNEFIATAETGDVEKGYSEALVKFDNDDYIPLKVLSMDLEQKVLD